MPTVVRKLPMPIKKIVGDLSDTDRLLVGLQVRAAGEGPDMTAESADDRWALTLYINGASPHSIHAIENARRLCEEELGGQVDLEIIDVQQEPALVVRDQIVAVPTLVRHMPAPPRRLVGDLSDLGQVRQVLELGPPESIDQHATPGG